MRPRLRATALLLLLAVTATLPGCIPFEIIKEISKTFGKILKIAAKAYGLEAWQVSPYYTDVGDNINLRFRYVSTPPSSAGGKPTRDYYLDFEGEGQRNNAFVRADYTLQGAFDVQFTTGRFDPGHALPPAGTGSFWAGELDLLGDDPANPESFVLAGFQYSENPLGTQVFVATDEGTQGSLFLPDATRIDARFQSDGKGSLGVWARPAFGSTFLEVDTVAIDPGARWQMGFGVVALGDGEHAGFDDAQVLANGPSGALPGSAEEACDRAWQAALHIADAHRLLDGSAPDQAEASQHLQQAEALIDQVAAYADQPGETDKPKVQLLGATLNYAKLARTGLQKAVHQLDVGKPVAKVRKTLIGALGHASKAMAGLEARANAPD